MAQCSKCFQPSVMQVQGHFESCFLHVQTWMQTLVETTVDHIRTLTLGQDTFEVERYVLRAVRDHCTPVDNDLDEPITFTWSRDWDDETLGRLQAYQQTLETQLQKEQEAFQQERAPLEQVVSDYQQAQARLAQASFWNKSSLRKSLEQLHPRFIQAQQTLQTPPDDTTEQDLYLTQALLQKIMVKKGADSAARDAGQKVDRFVGLQAFIEQMEKEFLYRGASCRYTLELCFVLDHLLTSEQLLHHTLDAKLQSFVDAGQLHLGVPDGYNYYSESPACPGKICMHRDASLLLCVTFRDTFSASQAPSLLPLPTLTKDDLVPEPPLSVSTGAVVSAPAVPLNLSGLLSSGALQGMLYTDQQSSVS